MSSHGEGYLKCRAGLALDLLLDGNLEDFQGHGAAVRLLISEGKHAACLPRPVGVVVDLDLDNVGHAGGELNDVFGLALNDGASVFPALLALEVLPVAAAFLTTSGLLLLPLLAKFSGALAHLLAELVGVEIASVVFAKVAHELLHHVLPGPATAHAAAATHAAAAATAASTTATTTSTELTHHLLEELHGVLGLALGFLLLSIGRSRLFLTKHGNHDIGGTTGLGDLKESVLVLESILTLGAVVKVLAHGALVSEALYRCNATAIALNALVDGDSLLDGHIGGCEVLRLEELFEAFLGLLFKLFIDQVLECLAGDALHLVGASLNISTVLLAGGRTLFPHLFVCGARCNSHGLSSSLHFDVEDNLTRLAGTGWHNALRLLPALVSSEIVGELEIHIVLDHHPVVTVVIAETLGLHVAPGCQLGGHHHERGIVAGHHALADGAAGTGQLEFDEEVPLLLCFNHS